MSAEAQNTDPRMKVRLETRDGELVASHLKMLPFNQHPDVVGWGQRIFKYHTTEQQGDTIKLVYREAEFFTMLIEDPSDRR